MKIDAENIRKDHQKILRINKIEELRKRYDNSQEFYGKEQKNIEISKLCS